METTLAALARDLERAALTVTEQAIAVVAKGALNVKNDARKNAEAHSGTHGRLYASSIRYDLDVGGLSAEIGPAYQPKGEGGQGNLAPILEYGSVHNPPHRDLGNALDAEEPRFLAEAAKIGIPWAL